MVGKKSKCTGVWFIRFFLTPEYGESSTFDFSMAIKKQPIKIYSFMQLEYPALDYN